MNKICLQAGIECPPHDTPDLALVSLEDLISEAQIAVDELESLLMDEPSCSTSSAEKVPVTTEIMNLCARAYVRTMYMVSHGTYWMLDEATMQSKINENFSLTDDITARVAIAVQKVDCPDLHQFCSSGFGILFEGREADSKRFVKY